MHPSSLSCLMILVSGFVSAHKQCMMPNRLTGKCRPIKECSPLSKLNGKRKKTAEDLQYIFQSTSSCDTRYSFQIEVCCPPESQWSSIKNFKPIKYDEDDATEVPELEKYETNSRNPDRGYPNRYVHTRRNITSIGSRSSIPKFECGQHSYAQDKIIGGNVADIDQFPWLVLLEYEENKFLCGGSLITTRYVLTAAHCIKLTGPKFARLAEYNTTSEPTDFVFGEQITVDRVPIEKNIAHPKYTLPHRHHDIGLSKLSRDAELSEFIQLICLPDRDLIASFLNGVFTVAGWGADGNGPSEVKKYVTVPFVPLRKCRLYYRTSRLILDSQICAGGNLNEDSCSGDSGGPLMFERNNTFVVVGVVSYGPWACGATNMPSVYTYVHSHLAWLSETMV